MLLFLTLFAWTIVTVVLILFVKTGCKNIEHRNFYGGLAFIVVAVITQLYLPEFLSDGRPLTIAGTGAKTATGTIIDSLSMLIAISWAAIGGNLIASWISSAEFELIFRHGADKARRNVTSEDEPK